MRYRTHARLYITHRKYLLLLLGAIHKRRTHARGEGGCQKCTKSVQGWRGWFRIVYVHIFEDVRSSDFFCLYKSWVIFEGRKCANIKKKLRKKIAIARANTQK